MNKKIFLSIISLGLILGGAYLLTQQTTDNQKTISAKTVAEAFVNTESKTKSEDKINSTSEATTPRPAETTSIKQGTEYKNNIEKNNERSNDSSQVQEATATPALPSNFDQTKVQTKVMTISLSIESQITVMDKKNYQIAIAPHSNVIDAMRALSKQSDFRFESQGFAGMGEFIKSINNAPNQQGAYWTLYINGKYSNQGASQTILQDQDRITWKLEKKY